ncbi:helix-turn-helix domain-containing protein [Actinomadura macrotermitis]|uniref:PucR family transcriptional regulator n=1 Tax=Actinomadura macrotermitis TaxID=2585200 RepID=A0A7K0BUG6_9ACTN|nr:hypothetical protein [Actinomadura macrotermitis]
MTTTPLDARPFAAIPDWVGTRLRGAIGTVADELLHEMLDDGRTAPGVDAGDLRAAIETGLGHFCDLLEDPGTGWDRVATFYRAIGRRMARDGRDPAETHQALRRSTLAAWRGITAFSDLLEKGEGTQAPSATNLLSLLVEAQFSYLDAVTSVVTAGYQAEARDAVETARLRRARLLALLLADPPADPRVIGALARQARWPLPRTVAAVAVRRRRGSAARLPVPDDLLVDFGRPEPHMLLPDPDGRAALLEPLTEDWVVAMGPAVPLVRACESLRWARDTLTLAQRGAIPDAGVVRSAENLPALVVFRAGELIADAAVTRLAPLRGLAPAQRDRLTRTLLALLENNFNAARASKRLRVHPQTVRYRLRQLEGLFGDDLRDPRRCLEMELILHARHGANGDRMTDDAEVLGQRVP